MKNLKRKIFACITAAAMATGTLLTCGANIRSSAADDGNDDWLHAEGSRLYDENGNEVWLTGANWFGFNCSENCFHYLWSADVDDVLSSIADHGINIIRVPISTELLLSWKNGKPNPVSSVSANTDPNYYLNPDFCESDGKTLKNSMEIFDVIMGKMKKYGLKCFVDVHSPDANNSGHNYNLWYGKATSDGTMVTTDVWIDTLTWLANKYKNDDTILGYDLKNEPHGKGQEGSTAAKWDGSEDENNWRYAATKCADSILSVNPNALIFVEGVEQSLKSDNYTWGQPDSKTDPPYIPAWWGGNLRGVKKYPVTPKSGTSQIVYSPHDYGPAVYQQTWFNKNFTEQTLLDDYWYDSWAYVNAEDIAPELMGEWGGYMDAGTTDSYGNDGPNQKWMTLLRDYMIKHHINHTFWCLNTNSGDTGGLWTSLQFSQGSGTKIEWDTDKYNLVKPALWQTSKTGKFIGLDHKTVLGTNGTGTNVTEYYKTYKDSEGSNLAAADSKGHTVEPSTGEENTTTSPTTTEPQSLIGDVDKNGKIELSDVVALSKYIVKIDTDKDKISLVNADINENKKVDSIDLTLLKQKIIK